MHFEIEKPVFAWLSRKTARIIHVAAIAVLLAATILSSLIVVKILSVLIDSVPLMTVLSFLSDLIILSLGASVFRALLEEHRWNFGGS